MAALASAEPDALPVPSARDVSFPDARRRAFLARDRFGGQMRSVPLARWTPRLVGLYNGNGFGHYQEHLGYLE